MAATFDGIQIAVGRRRISISRFVGKRISQIAAERKADPWDVYFQIADRAASGRIGALYHMMSEDDVATALRATFVTIGTDSSALRTEGVLAQRLAASALVRHLPAHSRQVRTRRQGAFAARGGRDRMTGPRRRSKWAFAIAA